MKILREGRKERARNEVRLRVCKKKERGFIEWKKVVGKGERYETEEEEEEEEKLRGRLMQTPEGTL